MRLVGLLTILTFLISAPDVAGSGTVEIRTGIRKIQLDGFLLEWKASDAHSWAADSSVVWDAMTTPEGIAGYFRSRGSDSCHLWTYTICFPPPFHHPCIDLHGHADDSTQETYRVNVDSIGATVEWLLRWKDLPRDSSGSIAVGFSGKSACGSSLQPVMAAVAASPKSGSVFTARVKMQIIAIVLLLAVFLIMRHRVAKVAKKTRRR